MNPSLNFKNSKLKILTPLEQAELSGGSYDFYYWCGCPDWGAIVESAIDMLKTMSRTTNWMNTGDYDIPPMT